MRASAPAAIFFAACTPQEADFTVRPGVEIATVLDADPGEALTLYDADGVALITLLADEAGQAHFAYIPDEYVEIAAADLPRVPFERGHVLRAGDGYEIRDDRADPPRTSLPFRVLAVGDVPDPALYDGQTLVGLPSSPLTGDVGDPQQYLQYVETRDGTLLSVMVRFPDPVIYGEGPFPTVIEYSGYSPSRPDSPDAGSSIANALGYATVGVNMRGTGCSGGVFDVFNPAQHADGYDVVEVVARQDWVLGGKVGMVGLSYPGISQLYVASTNPPSLAAVVPLSVVADPWEMQWPGGVYNAGFTRNWVEARDAESAASGTSWVAQRIADGDEVCAENQKLSSQNIDFEAFLHAMATRPPDTDARDLRRLVHQIEPAVFLGGQWQDEQTGAQFGAMLDGFDRARHARFRLTNGRHPDGYSPDAVFAWFEFLELYVADRVPKLNPLIRTLGSASFADPFGVVGYAFPADRFDPDDDVASVRAAYEAEPPVTVGFESGAGAPEAGPPTWRFSATYPAWPPLDAAPIGWFLAADGALVDAAPAVPGADAWTFDAEGGSDTFFGPRGYELLVPLWDVDWTRFAAGDVLAYETAPADEDLVLAGPGILDLYVNSPVDDVTVQATLTELRADGNEVLITSGWLRLGHRAATEGPDRRLERSYALDDFEPVPVDAWVPASVQIPAFAHPLRAGSRLRLSVSSPGRNHGTWEFEAPDYAAPPTFRLGRGGDRASALRLAVLPGIPIPAGLPACPSLRGQPCRDTEPIVNVTLE